MKHLLNNLTEEEKNSIREQHTGGMNVVTENFSRLIKTKSGDVKPLVNEQEDENNRDLFHKKTNVDGILISVKETMKGTFELYISDDNFSEVYTFEGDRGLAEGVFLQSKLQAQDGKKSSKVFKMIVDKLEQM